MSILWISISQYLFLTLIPSKQIINCSIGWIDPSCARINHNYMHVKITILTMDTFNLRYFGVLWNRIITVIWKWFFFWQIKESSNSENLNPLSVSTWKSICGLKKKNKNNFLWHHFPHRQNNALKFRLHHTCTYMSCSAPSHSPCHSFTMRACHLSCCCWEGGVWARRGGGGGKVTWSWLDIVDLLMVGPIDEPSMQSWSPAAMIKPAGPFVVWCPGRNTLFTCRQPKSAAGPQFKAYYASVMALQSRD